MFQLLQGKELEQNINVEAISPGIIYDFTKPAVPSSDTIPLPEFSDNEGQYEVEEVDDEKFNGKPGSRYEKVNSLHKRADEAAEDSSNVSDPDVDFDANEEPESYVDQSAEFWQSLGISRERKSSVSQILRDDFCEDDDHLETAEDAPDLEFQDRLHRRNSNVSVVNDESHSASTYDSLRQGKWAAGLRMPKR